MKNIKNIYDHIVDEKSRDIFLKRVMYSISNDVRFIIDIVYDTLEGKKIYEMLTNSDEHFLFGAGAWGKEIAIIWNNIPELSLNNNISFLTESKTWCGFLDNNFEKIGKVFNELKITSPKNISKNSSIFIATRLHYKEIVKQLNNLDINSSKIYNIGKILDEMAAKQYFDLDEMNITKNETFVDIGAYDGLTSIRFIEKAENEFDYIYCFEADKQNIEKCRKNLSALSGKVKIIEKAAWSKNEKLFFDNRGTGSSSVITERSGNEYIDAVDIDSVLKDRNVTFIKMDIEGSELEALKGAKNVISIQKPKLAISVYHKPEDILEIPTLLLKLNPDYQFYLRHYSLTDSETILYAI